MIDDLPLSLRHRLSVTTTGHLTPCWLWTASDSGTGRGGGYGRVSWDGQTWATHKLVWYLIRRRLLIGKRQLDHLCNQRRCCNPEHLEEVSHVENQKRRDRRRIERNSMTCA